MISATHSLAISDATAQDILKNLPDSLSPKRKKVIEAACSLVGKVNYCWGGKTARQMTKADYSYYDYIIAMDRFNLRNMTKFVGNDPDNKVSLMLDFTNCPGDVADPWYTGDFDSTWNDVYDGCLGLLKKLNK